MNIENVTCFNNSRVEHIQNKKLIRNTNMITNIYRIQAYDWTICGYFFIGFINLMLKVQSLLDCTNLFSPNEDDRNDKIILKHLQ